MSTRLPRDLDRARRGVKQAACRIGLHAWDVIHAGSPIDRYYTERCRNCRKRRRVRWMSR